MKKAFPFILLSLLFAFTALEAQITIESITTSDGFMGMGASVSTEKSYTQGDARREESNVKFTGGIMKHMSPKETQIEITRLDKEVIWQMNDKDKKYTEMTFAEFKKMMEEGLLNQPMTGKPESKQEKKPEGEPEYEWQAPVVKARDLGEKKEINGFNCKHYLVTVTTIGKQLATGKLDTLLLSADMWNSVSAAAAMKKANEFDMRLAKALGLDKMAQTMGPLMAQYGEQFKKLAEEMKKVEGYSILTETTASMTTHTMPKQTGEELEAAQAEPEPEPADVTDVKGAFGKMLGKKIKDAAKAKAEKSKADKPKGDPNRKVLFRSTTELKSISTGDLAADLFEVPAGYKLQEKKK